MHDDLYQKFRDYFQSFLNLKECRVNILEGPNFWKKYANTHVVIILYVHVGDQAVCLGGSLPASCVWYPAARVRPTQEECLPQSQCLIHMDMCTLPGIDIILVHVFMLIKCKL